MLSIIGLGLADPTDLSIRGFEHIKDADVVYLECYTSVLPCPTDILEKLCGKPIILADRAMVEQNAELTILKDAKEKNAAFLVIGDPLSATTHVDIWQRAL